MSTHIFTTITERFGYGKYLDLEIVIDNETKYINASKLCRLGNKRLKKWMENASSKELLQFFDDKVTGPNSGQWYYEIGRGDIDSKDDIKRNIIMGTYFHHKVIVHIAQWISCEFAVKVSEIVDDYVSRENERTIRALKGENKSLSDKVEELLATTRTIMNMNVEQNGKLDELTSEVRRMRVHLDNNTSTPNKREAILVYRNENDSKEVIRIRCGTSLYLKRFKANAVWYKEYNNISNSKKALNYMREHGIFTPEKHKTTKVVMCGKEDRVYLRKCLRELDNSYVVNDN